MKRIIFTLALALFGLPGHAIAQKDVEDQFVITNKEAFYITASEVACNGTVGSASWSSDGKYIVMVRRETDPGSIQSLLRGQRPAAPELSLVLYSLGSRKSTVLWKGSADTFTLGEVSWLTNSATGVATVTEKLRTEDPSQPPASSVNILMFRADTAAVTTVATSRQSEGIGRVNIMPSPSKPLAAVVMVRGGTAAPDRPTEIEATLQILDPSGKLSPVIAPPNPGANFGGWTPDGSSAIFYKTSKNEGTGKYETQFWQGDPLKRNFVSVPRGSWGKALPPAALELELQQRSMPMADANGVERRISSLWIVGSKDKGGTELIQGDASNGLLSPTLSGVVYTVNGVATVRRFISVPKQLAIQSMKAKERTALLMKGKMMATALMIYAGDNDDRIPGANQDIASILNPYLQNSAIMNGVVYTYAGGLLSDIKDPAGTEIGYVPGEGGKAVIYADGHVKWVKDP